jgi:hypothetical protein
MPTWCVSVGGRAVQCRHHRFAQRLQLPEAHPEHLAARKRFGRITEQFQIFQVSPGHKSLLCRSQDNAGQVRLRLQPRQRLGQRHPKLLVNHIRIPPRLSSVSVTMFCSSFSYRIVIFLG